MIGTRGQSLRLLHVTDPHLFADESQTIYGVQTALSLRKVLDEAFSAGTPRPLAILATGDIADDCSAGGYENFRRAVSPYGLPVFCLPGNHDEPQLMTERVNDGLFQYGGKRVLGDWGAVFIDTHVHQAPEGRVRADELARLDADLASFAGRPILVCLHHPPLPVGSRWLDGVGLRNADEFLAVIARHPDVKVVLAGHVHQEFDATRGGVRYLTTPSTCAQFTPHTPNCVMDLKPPGYRWLELHPDGSVDTQVQWLADWVVSQRPPDDRF